MIYKITNISIMNDSGLKRLSVTYDKISDTGKVVAVNKRKSRMVVDPAVLEAIEAIENHAHSVIEEV